MTVVPHSHVEIPVSTTRDYLSFSAISTYRQCPRRYFFRYVAGLPEESLSASLVFGSAIHSAVEYWFCEQLAGHPEPGLDVLLDVYRSAWWERDAEQIQFGKNENADTLAGSAERMLAVFIDSPVARPAGHILAVEEELRGPWIENCPDMLARLDLVVETPEELVVTDFKTSRSRWSATQAQIQSEQLLLYHELVRQLQPDKPVRLQYAVITKTKSPTIEVFNVPVKARQLDRLQRTVEQVWAAMQSGLFYSVPSVMNCTSCPFRRACDAWDA